VDENAPVERPKKRKKKQEDYTSDKRATQDNGEEKPRRERQTTSVYVANLPKDVSAAEIAEYFAKCGMIGEDASGQKRVKLYRDANGDFKGDALVTYFKPESVPLALQLLDETELPRADGSLGPTIRVQLVRSRGHWANDRPNSRVTRATIIRSQGNRKRSQRMR